jgi:hypothetical protein
MTTVRAATALLIVLVLLVGCAGVSVDLPTLPPAATTPAATTPAATTPVATTPAATTPAATTPAATTPAASTPPPGAGLGYLATCIRVVHETWEGFLSYLDFLLWLNGDDDVDYIEVTILGANDDEPVTIELTPEDIYRGRIGLRSPGEKEIVSVIVHFDDGETLDITEHVVADVGETFNARFPQEDDIGNCEDAPPR